jgi:hypothetical protein
VVDIAAEGFRWVWVDHNPQVFVIQVEDVWRYSHTSGIALAQVTIDYDAQGRPPVPCI